MKIWLLFALLATFQFPLFSSTIIPFVNLVEMARASNAVVYAECIGYQSFHKDGITKFRFQMKRLQALSGRINEAFEIQNLHLMVDTLERVVAGDIELEVGKKYLLFLEPLAEGVWQTKVLSYAVFEELLVEEEWVFSPLQEHMHMLDRPDGRAIEPLAIYAKVGLLDMLRKSILDAKAWKPEQIKKDLMLLPLSHQRSSTNHCRYIFNNPPAHWPNFPTQDLPVRYENGGDLNCSASVNQVQLAINQMNASYRGINLRNAGSHSYQANCAGGDAVNNHFTNWVGNTYGNSRQLIIQFDDPCNEISNLNRCSGVYAYGGLYGSSNTHTENGSTWRDAAYGYVVVNNGVGNCICNDRYSDLLIHEMTHALGFGHIPAGFGLANMNPSGFTGIQDLDIECLDDAYQPTVSSGVPCNAQESLVNQTINNAQTIQASSNISLRNVTLNGNANLQLRSPNLEIIPSFQLNAGARLEIDLNSGCN